MWSKLKESGLFGLDASVGHFDVLDFLWIFIWYGYSIFCHNSCIAYILLFCNGLTIISNANSFKLIQSCFLWLWHDISRYVWLYISQLWLDISQLWIYISQLWLYLTIVFIIQNYEFISHNCDFKIPNYDYILQCDIISHNYDFISMWL